MARCRGGASVLAIRSFRRLWIGLGLSSLGDWLGLLALTAMASALADDNYADQNFAIAGVLFLRVLPAIVLGPLAGYIADRLDRRWTLIIGDVLRGLVFASIPFVNTLTWVLIATVIIEAISLVWLPAKDATDPQPGAARASSRPPTGSRSRRRTARRCRRPALFIVLQPGRPRASTRRSAGSTTRSRCRCSSTRRSFIVSGPRDRHPARHPARLVDRRSRTDRACGRSSATAGRTSSTRR